MRQSRQNRVEADQDQLQAPDYHARPRVIHKQNSNKLDLVKHK